MELSSIPHQELHQEVKEREKSKFQHIVAGVPETQREGKTVIPWSIGGRK